MTRWASAFVLFAACSSNTKGNENGPDAAPPAPDAAIDAQNIVMGMPTQPTDVNDGGSVLAAPKVVPVFFTGDGTAQATVEDFLSMLPSSSYWTAISSEYGVGALTIAPSVIATETPPTDDNAIAALVDAHAGGTGGWPAADANTIYALFFPDGVTITAGGTSCVDFGGYHSESNASNVYAVMPRCSSMTYPGLDYVTIATSHEVLEASTDPHPYTDAAYTDVDDEHAIWGLVPGGELGDMCETAKASFQPLLGSYWVQRTWSNASAAAGHDPCVPVLATPYVEAMTNLPDISIDDGQGGTITTPGVTIPVGQSKTVEVDLYADAPAADWTVVPIDAVATFYKTNPDLSFQLDRTTGNTGDKLMLTITRLQTGSYGGISELGLQSQVNGVTVGTWFALVN